MNQCPYPGCKKRFRAWLGQKVCDFGLWILGLGPKDPEDQVMYKQLIQQWRKFQVMRVTPEDAAFLRSYNRKQSGQEGAEK